MSGAKADRKAEQKAYEARKGGLLPPQLDEDGKEINPHIPQFIAKAPWYMASGAPSLKHQRSGAQQEDTVKLDEWYQRGARKPAATTFRKGACKNCGAMTHTEKLCTERPRKIGAKYTGREIAPDEVIQELKFDWDSKRDRWAGYDTSQHLKMIKEYEAAEVERRKQQQHDLLQQFATEPDSEQKRYPSGTAIPSGVDSKTRTTVRDLRIREDTAKYLRNLNTDSAHYDPKTRSMKENPNPELSAAETAYVGDDFVRYSGEVVEMTELQLASLREEGQLHPEAAPTQALLLQKQMKERKEQLAREQRQRLLEKYGGEEHLDKPAQLPSQTDAYVEYGRDGRVITRDRTEPVRSRYVEDVYEKNHTAVWGSYWYDGQWGYACCKQVVRNAYCTGAAGREAAEEAEQRMKERTVAAQEAQTQQQEQQQTRKRQRSEEPPAEV